METGLKEKPKLEDLVAFGGKRAWVGKRFHFDSAHFLPYHKGKCANLHGHRWFLDLELEGPINEEGMVIDFGLLKAFIDGDVLQSLDHHTLNDSLFNPTAENLCYYLVKKIASQWPPSYPHVRLTLIKVWESDTAFAMIRPNIELREATFQ